MMEIKPDKPAAATILLAAHASLNLSPDRLTAVESILAAWLPAARELSLKMSAPAHQDLLPVTVFAHAHGSFEDLA